MADREKDNVRRLPRRLDGRFDRRQLMQRAGALSLSIPALGLATSSTAAYQASPSASPAAPGVVTKSITREAYAAQLAEAFPMEEPAVQGGELIHGEISDISTVNAMLGADQPTNPLLALIFETLQGTSVIDGSVVPGLADSWEIAEDGVTYTFHLNPNATWHDGQPVTADDVSFSLDMQLNPDTASQYTSTVAGVVDSYRVVDEHTFEVKSTGIQAFFLYDFYVPIMPKHVWENVAPADWATDAGSTGEDPSRVVGSGPFKFVEWVQEDHVTLEKNPDYWDTVTGQVPVIDRFTMRVLPSQETQNQALTTGEIDIIEDISDPSVEQMKQTEGVVVDQYDTFDFSFYGYNMDPAKTPVFQDREVRVALFQALDRQQIIDSIFAGLGEVAVGTQAVLSPAYAPDQYENTYPFDMEAAKQLLESAGWVDSDGDGIREKDGNKLEFGLTYTEQVATYEQMVPYMQQQWRDIGAEMTPQAVPFPSLLDTINQTHDYGIALLGFSWDPSGNQEAMFASDQYNGGFNFMRYSNPEWDALMEETKHELDAEKRVQNLIELSKIAWNDLPVGIYKFSQNATGSRQRMHNYYPNDYSFLWSLPFVWAEEV